MKVFLVGRVESLYGIWVTLAIAVVAHNYGGEKSEGIFREHALFDFIVGDDLSLSLCIDRHVPYQFLNILHGPWI